MMMKKKPRDKIEFYEIRYPKAQKKQLRKKLIELTEIEEHLCQRKITAGEPYREVYPQEYAIIKQQAQQMLDWVEKEQIDGDKFSTSFIGTFSVNAHRMKQLSGKVIRPKVEGWFIKYAGVDRTASDLSEAQIEIQAAQINVWLEVWNISVHDLKSQYAADFRFDKFLRDVAIERKFGTNRKQTEHADNHHNQPQTKSADGQSDEQHPQTHQKNRQSDEQSQPTQKQHQKDNLSPKKNDLLTEVIGKLCQRFNKLSEEYHDVIRAIQQPQLELQEIYPILYSCGTRQQHLDRRKSQMLRSIRSDINQFSKGKPVEEQQKLEKDVITHFWGEEVADGLNNIKVI